MSHTIILKNIYFDIRGIEFVPIGFDKGALKKPSHFWSDQLGRKAKTYFDANGRRLKKGNFFDDKNHRVFQRRRQLNGQKMTI